VEQAVRSRRSRAEIGHVPPEPGERKGESCRREVRRGGDPTTEGAGECGSAKTLRNEGRESK